MNVMELNLGILQLMVSKCFFLFQLSDLHKLMIEAAKVLNVEAPDLYVRQNPVPNAYTLAISGKKPFVVVHTGLVELLTEKELQVSSYLMLLSHLIAPVLTKIMVS